MLTGGRKAAGVGFDGAGSCAGHPSRRIPAFAGIFGSVCAVFQLSRCTGQPVAVSSCSSPSLQRFDNPFSPTLLSPCASAASKLRYVFYGNPKFPRLMVLPLIFPLQKGILLLRCR